MALCKHCILNSKEGADKGNHEKFESLVTQPFSKWKDTIIDFNHSKDRIKNLVIREKRLSDACNVAIP